MNEINTVIDIIGNLGVSVGMLAYFIYNNLVTMKTMDKTINDNTLVLTRLLERMDEGDLLDREGAARE